MIRLMLLFGTLAVFAGCGGPDPGGTREVPVTKAKGLSEADTRAPAKAPRAIATH